MQEMSETLDLPTQNSYNSAYEQVAKRIANIYAVHASSEADCEYLYSACK